jgi:hypothetical protein
LTCVGPARAEELGRDAEQQALEYLAGLILRLDMSGKWQIDGAIDLRVSVTVLAAYAKGLGTLDAPVVDYLQTICEALWIRPIDGVMYETPDLDLATGGDLDSLKDDLRGRLCLIMVAAVGRERLSQDEPVTVAQLAALASHSPDSIRRRGRDGTLRLRKRDGALTCSAADAQTYLAASRLDISYRQSARW